MLELRCHAQVVRMRVESEAVTPSASPLLGGVGGGDAEQVKVSPGVKERMDSSSFSTI